MIDRRDFIKYSSASLLGTTLLNSCQRNASQESNAVRPNLIVLIADDLRWDCMGSLNDIIQTPNLDQLANQGTIFFNNFVTTSICPAVSEYNCSQISIRRHSAIAT
ncbi:MAG: sulfatase-like hydrolase/transferase [Pleurocapsa sp.]